MASRVIKASISSSSNTDLKGGGSAGFSVTSDTGTVSNATVKSASLYISSFKTYSSNEYLTVCLDGYEVGETDTLDYNESSHSSTESLSDLSSKLLTVSPDSISLDVVATSGTGYKINFRSGCTVTLTVEYTLNYTACTAPTAVSVSANNVTPSSNVTLSWSGAKAGTGNAITGYEVYRSTSASGTYSLLTTVSSSSTAGTATVTAGSNGTTYYYKVKTIGTVSGYSSALSSVYASLYAVITACAAPTSVAASGSSVAPGALIVLSWSGAVAGTNNAIAGYAVYYGTTTDCSTALSATISTTATSGSYSFYAPSATGTYYYKVITVGAAGSSYNSARSTAYATVKIEITVNGTPTGITLTPPSGKSISSMARGEQATLSWTAPSAGTNNGISKYQIYRSTEADGTYTALTTSASTSCYVTSPTSSGSSYYYKIAALSTVGSAYNSALSAASSALRTWYTALGAPTASVSDTYADGNVTVSWSDASAGTNTDIGGYQVQYEESSDGSSYGSWADIATDISASTESCSVAIASARGSWRKYRVRAVYTEDTAYSSPWAETAAVQRAVLTEVTLDKSTVPAGETIQITLTPGKAAVTSHTLKFRLGNYVSSDISLAAGTTSYTYTIPVEFCKAIPNAESGTMSVQVTQTVSWQSGSGSASVPAKTFTMTVPEGNPSFTLSITRNSASELVPDAANALIAGLDTLTADLLDTASTYSSTWTCLITCGTYSSNTVTLTTGTLAGAAAGTTYTVTAVVTDSRGRSTTQTADIIVYGYSRPNITLLSASRCEADGKSALDGTYAKLTPTYTYSTSSAYSNSVESKWQYRLRGTATWSDLYTETQESGSTVGPVGGSLESSSSYDLKFVLQDKAQTVSAVYVLTSAQYTLHLKSGGKGAAFGMESERDNSLSVSDVWEIRHGNGLLENTDDGYSISAGDGKVLELNPDGTVSIGEIAGALVVNTTDPEKLNLMLSGDDGHADIVFSEDGAAGPLGLIRMDSDYTLLLGAGDASGSDPSGVSITRDKTTISGDGEVTGDLAVTGSLSFGSLDADSLNLSGGVTAGGAVSGQTLASTGNTTVGGALSVTGNATVSGNADVTGNLSADGSLFADNGLLYLTQQSTQANPVIYFRRLNSDGAAAIWGMMLQYYNTNRLAFRHYCPDTSDSTKPGSYYEEFYLPTLTSGRTSNGGWNILTTKYYVSIAQGGTGTGTAAGALSNLGGVAKAGDTMTGNLSIQTSLYPSLYLLPTYNSTTNRTVFEGSYTGASSFASWNDSTGNNRRMLEVRNSGLESSLDNAVMVRSCVDGTWGNYRVFHAGMATAVPVANGGTGATDAATARTNLGVTLANLGAAASSHNHSASNITSGTIAAARLPFKVAYGSTSCNGSTAASIDYSSAGFTAVPKVVVSYSTTSSNWSGDNGALKIYSKTTTGCSVIVGGSFSTKRNIDWIAIGT